MKERLVLENYALKVSLGNLIFSLGTSLSYGKGYQRLFSVYRIAIQILRAFDWEAVQIEPDFDKLKRWNLELRHMLKDFLPPSPLEIAEYEIVKYGAVPNVIVAGTVKYGWNNTGIISQGEIETSPHSLEVGGVSSFAIPFNQQQEYKYIWAAEPKNQAPKTKWRESTNSLNRGSIGNPEDLFKVMEVGEYRLYVSDYKTSVSGQILFF